MTRVSDNNKANESQVDYANYTSLKSIMASTPMKNHKTVIFNPNDISNVDENDNEDDADNVNHDINNNNINSEHEKNMNTDSAVEEDMIQNTKNDNIINNEEEEEDNNPYLEKVKQIERLLSSVTTLEYEVKKKNNSDNDDYDDEYDDDDNLSNEISQLTETEIELRKELEEAVGGKDNVNNHYDTSLQVPLVCSNKSLVDDLEEEEEESEEEEEEEEESEGYLTLAEKVGWDDDFEQVRSPTSGYVTTYESWEDQIEQYEYDTNYPTIILPNTILSNQQDQRCVYENTNILIKCHREYIIPPPSHHLESMFIGIRPPSSEPQSCAVRMAYIQIRPDVRCGCVMDALAYCITSLHGVIRKRQGGYFIAYIPALTQLVNPYIGKKYAPIHMEAQLLTRRKNTNLCQRILLLQFFIPSKNTNYDDDLYDEMDELQLSSTINNQDSINSSNDNINETYYEEDDNLSEIARLWQYNYNSNDISTANKPVVPSNILNPDNEEVMGYFITSPIKLLFQPTTTSLNNNDTNNASSYYMPSTLEHMTPYINNAWIIINKIIDQLEVRYLSYNTILKASLLCSTIGLPTLPSLFDAQYCGCLQIYTHDIMVHNIIKVSDDIESYAKEEENKTNLLLNMLLDTFELYDMEFLDCKANMLPLSAYPLNYTPAAEICPPWGAKVKLALQDISTSIMTKQQSVAVVAPSYTDTKELINAFTNTEIAIKKILIAFTKQYEDEEQATISRKNMHVMNRINKLQIFKRECVLALHHAYGSYSWATKASDDFFNNAVTAIQYPINNMTNNNIEPPQVPLFKCPIVLYSEGIAYNKDDDNHLPSNPSSCTTICYVSLHYILICITTAPMLLSVFSKPTCLLFDLKACKIEYVVQPSIKVDDNEEMNEENSKVCIISNYKDEHFNTMDEDVIVSFRPCCTYGGSTITSSSETYSSSKLFVDFCNLVKNIDIE